MTDLIPKLSACSTRRDFLFALTAMGGGLFTDLVGARRGALRADDPADDAAHDWPLFSVEANGHRVYLTGETPPRPTRWHDERIESLVPRCSALWTETNNVYKRSVDDLIARYGVDKSAPLESHLTDTDRERLAKAAELGHVPVQSLATFRPWVAGSVLEDAYYQAAGMADAADKVLVAEANSAGITVSSEFPTKDDVIEWFASMSPEQGLQFFRYSLDTVLAGPEENQRVFGAWAKGDAGPAAGRVADLKRLYPDLYPKLVVERNKNWVPRFTAMLERTKPVLVLTGLYHLVGPDSLLVQLRARGLTVRQI
jgi:uncharacterized protein